MSFEKIGYCKLSWMTRCEVSILSGKLDMIYNAEEVRVLQSEWDLYLVVARVIALLSGMSIAGYCWRLLNTLVR